MTNDMSDAGASTAIIDSTISAYPRNSGRCMASSHAGIAARPSCRASLTVVSRAWRSADPASINSS